MTAQDSQHRPWSDLVAELEFVSVPGSFGENRPENGGLEKSSQGFLLTQAGQSFNRRLLTKRYEA